MPSSRVLVQLSTATASVPQETFNDVIVFARASSSPPGDIDYNQKKTYRRPSDVAADVGDGSDAHVASQALDAMGVAEWSVIVVEATETTEVIGDSDTSSVSSGSVQNTPMAGHVTAQVSIDGTDLDTVTAVTDSPPDADATPESTEAFVNYDTGEVVTGETSSGTGTGIEVTYTHLDWTSAFAQLNPTELDLATLADVRADAKYVGDLDEVVQWGSGDYVHTTAASVNFADYATESEALTAAQDVAAYVQSGDFSVTAHKSDDDVAAFVAGLYATKKVWADPSYHATGFPGLNTQGWTNPANIVGDPETTGTIEGGKSDAGLEHAGAMNALDFADGSLVLSNDLTTLGHGSSYKYLDIRRTEGLVVTEARRALISLLKRERIPFNATGQQMIDNALGSALREYEYDLGPYSDLDVQVPAAETLDASDRANRIWGVIPVSYRVNGDVHRFSLDIRTTA
ncbi:hypothetical protein [Halomarina oriensis]|uniref:DUF3383 family protein n=1 Tax=Halomarina oriensis TaxID=671145 RepID=A0A6B0GP40_9EURY|nr:hypothetical protein [Halomarina oriensis]MWG36460.1 hypothetical protein [Halomarina oriensis]